MDTTIHLHHSPTVGLTHTAYKMRHLEKTNGHLEIPCKASNETAQVVGILLRVRDPHPQLCDTFSAFTHRDQGGATRGRVKYLLVYPDAREGRHQDATEMQSPVTSAVVPVQT